MTSVNDTTANGVGSTGSAMKLMTRFTSLGIQKRIMLYVAVGLVLMFGAIAFVGLQSVQDATDRIFEERLGTARTVAGVLGRDFVHVAADVREASPALLSEDLRLRAAAAQQLLDHLFRTDPFPFFEVRGVWVLDNRGNILAQAGEPTANLGADTEIIASASASLSGEQFVVLPAPSGPAGHVPFGTVVTRVSAAASPSPMVVAVHTVSRNRSSAYHPALYFQEGSGANTAPRGVDESRANYYLEIVRPDGLTILGIGEDERPGEISRHLVEIQSLLTEAKPATLTLLHKPDPGENFEPHVMALVPVPSSPFVLILEQPEDVALALPLSLQRRLMAFLSLGLAATLLVAWVTTLHVVSPTVQLTIAARRMAEGDLEDPIAVRAQDEVGKLAESLEIMRQKLRAAYQQIESSNKELEQQVRERTARLTEMLGKVISAQEEERYRLARELHDETAQTLGALSIALDRTRDCLPDASPEALEQLSEGRAIVSRLLEDTRRLILDLRPLLLDDMGLVPAIRWYAETRLGEAGVEATVEMRGGPIKLPPHLEVAIFRVLQEAVNNIAKHAGARHARVSMAQRDSVVTMTVSDDGRGFAPDRVLAPDQPVKAVGLLGMQERVRLLNGRLDIHSREGQGTEVRIEIPLSSAV